MKTDWFLPLEFNNSRDFRIKCQIITYITTQQLLSFCLMGMFNNKHQTLHPQLKVNFVFALEMEFCLLTQILLQYNAIIGITEKFRLERFMQQEQWLPVFTAYYKTINQTHYTPSLTEMCAHAVHSEMKQNPQFADDVKHCIPDELYKMASNEPTFQRFYEDTEMAKTIGKKLDLKRPGIRQPR